MTCKMTEYGNVGAIFHGDTPDIAALRIIVRNFDEAMEGLGLDPKKYEREARLVTTGRGRPFYDSAGWYLKVHSRKCCHYDL